MSWLQTRNYAFIGFVFFASIAGICLAEAYVTNPYLPKIPSSKPTTFQTMVGQRIYTIPNILHAGTTNEMAVWCNVTGYNIAVGSPVYVAIVVEIQNDVYDVISVDATVRDAFRCEPFPWENYPLMQPLTPSRPYLSSEGSSQSTFFPFEAEVYKGDDIVEFQASGSVDLTVTVTLLPPSYVYGETDTYNEYKALFPDGKYTVDVPLDSIVIESGLTSQQQNMNNLNLSLTYFVLFFASIDIAVLFFDHSEDKEKKEQYEAHKAEKKRRKVAEKGQEIV
jgi:hypothetical protein